MHQRYQEQTKRTYTLINRTVIRAQIKEYGHELHHRLIITASFCHI
jgi:hypothetical protein